MKFTKINELMKSNIYVKYKIDVSTSQDFDSIYYDEKGIAFGQYGTTHSTTLFTHMALLRTFFDVLPKGEFLDLGSGVGNILIYASNQGWKAIGIEFSKGCIKGSIKNIALAKEKGYDVSKIQLRNENFFPLKFKIEKMLNNSNEDDFRVDLEKIKVKHTSYNFFADLWYHYQVERRQNILNLFSEFAKQNALLIFVQTKDDSFVIPNDIILLDNYEGMFIYKKI
ncbi:MAG: hypothetical protein ACMXYG_04220 [Candidatus Woesearchaeota archaeon]